MIRQREGLLGGSAVEHLPSAQDVIPGSGIESSIRLPIRSLLLPLLMSQPLSLGLSWINKILKKKNARQKLSKFPSHCLINDYVSYLSLWNWLDTNLSCSAHWVPLITKTIATVKSLYLEVVHFSLERYPDKITLPRQRSSDLEWSSYCNTLSKISLLIVWFLSLTDCGIVKMCSPKVLVGIERGLREWSY